MCGIIGGFGILPDPTSLFHRGKDEYHEVRLDNGYLGHHLHAQVGHAKQPIEGEGYLITDCEIYNWKELNDRFGWKTKNDTETLLRLLDLSFNPNDVEQTVRFIREHLDGVYSFVYYRDDYLMLMRDPIGVRPLWYVHDERGIAFASEGKSLYPFGIPRELHPRHTLIYHIPSHRLTDSYIPWNPLKTEYIKTDVDQILDLLTRAVRKRTEGYDEVPVLFSGDTDSTLLVGILLRLGKRVVGYVSGTENSSDVHRAKRMGEEIGIPVRTCVFPEDQEELHELTASVVHATETSDPFKIGVALPLYLSALGVSRDGYRMVLTPRGADDIFAGDTRYIRAQEYGHDLNRELLTSLRTLYERDLYRDDTVIMAHTVEPRLPYLDRDLVSYVMNTDPKDKLSLGRKTLTRRLLNILYDEGVLPKINPVQLAAQYGSGANSVIVRLSKEKGYRSPSEYLSDILRSRGFTNPRLCVLFSGGKDSGLALWMMKKRGYPIVCLLIMMSENPESYMFHTPHIQEAPEIARRSGYPAVIGTTHGEKEKELDDLVNLLREGVKRYGMDGVVSGAIASVYQRNRIEEVCERLGLKVYLPLWYMDQEEELKLLFTEGFRFKIVNPSIPELQEFSDRELTPEDIPKLKKLGINVSGEGGEYETVITRAPFFSDDGGIDS